MNVRMNPVFSGFDGLFVDEIIEEMEEVITPDTIIKTYEDTALCFICPHCGRLSDKMIKSCGG